MSFLSTRTGLSVGIGSYVSLSSGAVDLSAQLYAAAVSAAQAAGASLWMVPPNSATYGTWATEGPFINSDGSGGNPTLGSGVVGYV